MIGVDIEDIARFRKLDRLRDRRFFERIFTKREMKYCFSKTDSAPHLTARFCAKEAVIKALGGMGIHRVPYSKIEIVNTSKGVPRVILHSRGEKLQIKVSLAHAHDYAMACAVIL